MDLTCAASPALWLPCAAAALVAAGAAAPGFEDTPDKDCVRFRPSAADGEVAPPVIESDMVASVACHESPSIVT